MGKSENQAPAKVYQLSCGHRKPLKNRGQYKDEIRCFACGKQVKIGAEVASS